VSFNGCSEHNNSAEPIWKQVKISELKPSAPASSKTHIDIDVYIFEVPTENLATLTNFTESLHTEPLRFYRPDAFKANGFSAGFAREQMWPKLGDWLRKAGAKLNKKTALLFFQEQSNDVSITKVKEEQTIFYNDSISKIEEVTLEPGSIALRINAKRLPGSQGICDINVTPVYKPAEQKQITQWSRKKQLDQFTFEAVAFELKVSPGDFVFIAPQQNQLPKTTLNALFFSEAARRGTMRIYLIVCRRISE